MAIGIVDFPIENGDFPLLWDSSPEGTRWLCQQLLENGPVEIVDLPILIAWWCSSSLCKRLPEGNAWPKKASRSMVANHVIPIS